MLSFNWPRRHRVLKLTSCLKSTFGGVLLVSVALAAPVMADAPQATSTNLSSLAPQSQAEWQRLLSGQESKVAVKFDDRTIPNEPLSTFGRLFAWNEIALDTTAIDHTPPATGQKYVFGQQFGPPRAARAMAIVHIAMFEAVNAIYHDWHSYTGLARVSRNVPADLAIAQAAHDALVYLYPSQKARLDALLAFDSKFIKTADVRDFDDGWHDGPGVSPDVASQALGKNAAASIIALRSNDGSQTQEPVVGVNFTPRSGPGFWSPDPISQSNVALGANWGQVKPFVMQRAAQFRPPPPPSLNSKEWIDAFNQTEELGGDPSQGTPTKRTPDQTIQGIFWTYDGVPNICAPPRLYNQIARTLIFERGIRRVSAAARFLALLNTAMADSALTAWEAKWHYQFWRPITAIRFTGGPANHALKPDPNFVPLGAPATNTHGPSFTPPFPAYPSGHATIGGAVFETLRAFFEDNQPFTFVSDEFNGKNFTDNGELMPLIPITFNSLTEAEHDNAESRIWIGVHWQFDADQGVAAGRRVADYVLQHAFQPIDNFER